MAFDSTDLYTLSGGVTIFNYWNPHVTKHDTSSFYNWEQDNLPLYDLEERTHYLWEKLGYPLSGVPSMALVVSSSIPTDMELSSNVFTSIEDAIEALPEIIRMPTLIEVAVSGELGAINLNNIKCEDDGVLEIVNRGFAPLLPSENAIFRNVGSMDADHFHGGVFDASAALDRIDDTSALSVSANVAGLFPADGDGGGYVRTMYVGSYSASSSAAERRPAYGIYAANNPGTGTVFRNGDDIGIDEVTQSSDGTLDTLDLSTVDETTGDDLRDSAPAVGTRVAGFMTANSVSSIQVENSDGPIYIRGFVVDGYSVTEDVHTTEVGIHVANCNDLTLEYCGAMRCTTGGLEVLNSKVNLRRGFGAVRNYDIANRATTDTYGIMAMNSQLELVTDTYTSGIDFYFGVHHHDRGIHLINSKLMGGDVRTSVLADSTVVAVGFNDTNILAENSEVELDGVLDVYNGVRNIHSIGSTWDMEQVVVRNAQKEGILLDQGSRFVWNRNLFVDTTFKPTVTSFAGGLDKSYMTTYTSNGSHIVCGQGSYYGPTMADNMPSYYLGEAFFEHHGAGMLAGSKTSQSGVVADGGKVELVSAKMVSKDAVAALPQVAGLLAKATNGGTLVLRAGGSTADHAITWIQGPVGFTDQIKTALVAATKGSKVYVHGPTAIVNAGVGILSQDNSVAVCSPHTDETNGAYDASSWIQGDLDHTLVEIHASRACMVADGGSRIVMKDLGDFGTMWPAIHSADADYSNTLQSADTSAGGMQFYPNPMEGDTAVPDITAGTDVRTFSFATPTTSMVEKDASTSSLRIVLNQSYADSTTSSDIRTFSLGGMCVRATRSSDVTCKNVHFPMGHVQADFSFFDPSASVAGCADLRIWNIADTSRLDAAYTIVSGNYPNEVGYHGPHSTYFSGTAGDSSGVAYGFEGVSDTSTISVLDHFGSGVDVSAGELDSFMLLLGDARRGESNSYGASSFENQGPFRLYFSAPPMAKALKYEGRADGDNLPYQHLSQGYNLSGAVEADSSLSSIYPGLLKEDTVTGDLVTSGIYQMSSFYQDVDPRQVVVDESALNTFANAKHCTTDHSGRKKFVTLHRAKTNVFGEGHSPSVSGLGVGFRSSNVFDLDREV